MSPFRTTILTPDSCAFDQEADSLVVPGKGGSFGILANHAPLVGAVAPGVLKVGLRGATQFIALGEGMVEVARNSVVFTVDVAIGSRGLADAEQKVAEYVRLQSSPPLCKPDIAAQPD
jgi:F-type H+-transporting ATPase subunit epsilon